MFWIIFGTVIFLLFFLAVGYFFVSDRKKEKRSVAEALSKDMWDEIAAEREEALRRAEKFKEILKTVNRKS